MYTNRDAQNYVITCIEDSGVSDHAEYDIDAIVADFYAIVNTYDFGIIGHAYIPEFWEIVRRREL